jgi:Starch-binding associating with outer membrane
MKLYKYLLLVSLPIATAVSCKKSEFVQANINPSTLITVDPSAQFLTASSNYGNSFEYYYDIYRAIAPWMQYWTSSAGNTPNFTLQSGNFNTRYGNFYGNVGLPLADIPHLIEKMTTAQQAQRVYENSIAAIYKAYYAFYVSDINGSIPYSQAFEARYGGTLTPEYDPQQQLFDTLDLQVKTAVASLEASQSATQVLYGGNDPFFGVNYTGGEVMGWVKAGNALRLKMASRLMKADPTTLSSIVADVLSDQNQMSSVADSWSLYVGPSYADAGGNFNPGGFLSAKPLVDFMNKYTDPRLTVFYRPNSSGVYVGSPTDPDTCTLQFYQNLYKATDTPFSPIQHRLWTPNYNENDGFGAGGGNGYFPVLTYAEYCFLRADFAARGLSSDDAATWYNNAVTASIVYYDARAKDAQLTAYTPLGAASAAAAAAAYLLQPGIAYDPTKGVEQIGCQAYIEMFKNPSEGWAWWRRTGYPNTTSVLAWSPLTTNGATNVLSRRAALTTLTTSDANYANQQKAYTQMETSPYFGANPADGTGRVWWNAP